MDFMYDLNHVISLYLDSTNEPLHLVPTTRISDMILMHDSCVQCSSVHDTQWQPDWVDPVGGKNVARTSKSFVYIYLEHQYQVSTTGYYWRINACLNPPDEQNNLSDGCAEDLLVYAVHEAEPEFKSLGDGYFGLSPSKGIGGSEKMNLLE